MKPFQIYESVSETARDEVHLSCYDLSESKTERFPKISLNIVFCNDFRCIRCS